MKALLVIRIVATVIAVVILGQTLPYKFSGAQESVDLFTKLGLEPFGRIGIGIAELIAILLLIIPRTAIWGGLMTMGLMTGALLSHLAILGFAGEMGLLAAVAGVTLLAAATVVFLLRDRIPLVGPKFAPA
ncbi:MAG: DoxX family protein [Verrucomicrobiota bacterium]